MRLTTNASFAVGCQYFANVVLCTTLKPNGFNKLREKIEHLECICVYCFLAIYIDFVLYSAKSSGKKMIGNVTVKNYL